jgi:hypothetical protein
VDKTAEYLEDRPVGWESVNVVEGRSGRQVTGAPEDKTRTDEYIHAKLYDYADDIDD